MSSCDTPEEAEPSVVRRGTNALRQLLHQYPEIRLIVPHVTRLLARGEPITVEQIAEAAGLPHRDVQVGLDRNPGVERDDLGRIVGFGLTLIQTPHRFTTGGRTLYAWCATDALGFPVILGQRGVIESTCPATGQTITVEATPDRVVRVDPAGAVVSAVRPTERIDDIRVACRLGNFFSSREAAAPWLASNPSGQVLSVEEDFEIDRKAFTEFGWRAP